MTHLARAVLAGGIAVLLSLVGVEHGLAGIEVKPLDRRLDRALRVRWISPAETGAVVIDLQTGVLVYQRNEGKALVPASTQKLAVGVAALTKLGADFRFKTEVLGHGKQKRGVWKGDVILKGYGDPTLRTADLDELARKIRGAGIRRVEGRILGDESFFDRRRTAPGWKSSFYLVESPPLTALVVDRARVRGRVTKTPARAAARALRAALVRAGVRVTGKVGVTKAAPDALPLAGVLSEQLSVILLAMNRDSDNFVAEALLKGLGARVGGSGTTAAGTKVVRQVLRKLGVPLGRLKLADGSGLSSLNRLTPRALGALLVEVWKRPKLRRPFLSSLAVAGINGTLEHRLRKRPARGRVRAKTGTTSLSSSLAGYVGDRYAFAILMNGDPIPWWWARRGQDRFVRLLAAQ